MAKDEPRGRVLEILFVTQYPDKSVKIGRLNAENVKQVTLDPEIIKKHIGPELTAAEWNRGDWKKNPSLLIDSMLNGAGRQCGWYCQHGGHLNADSVSDLEPIGFSGAGPHSDEKGSKKGRAKPVKRKK